MQYSRPWRAPGRPESRVERRTASTTTCAPFVCGLVSVFLKTGDMQKHVRPAVIRHDEPETLGDIEPLYATAYFEEFGVTLALAAQARREDVAGLRCRRSPRQHPAPALFGSSFDIYSPTESRR